MELAQAKPRPHPTQSVFGKNKSNFCSLPKRVDAFWKTAGSLGDPMTNFANLAEKDPIAIPWHWHFL